MTFTNRATFFFPTDYTPFLGLPRWLSGKESTCQYRKLEFDPWFGRIPHALGQLSPCTTTTEPVLYSQELQLPGSHATTTEALAA